MQVSEKLFSVSGEEYIIMDTNGTYFDQQFGTMTKQSLQLHHNECDGVPNHRRLGCFRYRLFRGGSKNTLKFSFIGLSDRWISLKKGQ